MSSLVRQSLTTEFAMTKRYFVISLLLCLVLGGNSASLAANPSAAPKQWCIVAEDRLDEMSGLAPHRGSEETLLWANNDGPHNQLYLLDSQGATRATLEIDGIDPVDCEDLCSFQINNNRFLLLADTGDNDQRRKSVKLYLLKEPNLSAEMPVEKKNKKNKPPQFKQRPLATIEFTYPNGARNCEAVGVDVGKQTILLVAKEKKPGCDVYTLPLPLDESGKLREFSAKPQVAKHIAHTALPTITGMALEPDGRRLFLIGKSELFEFIPAAKPVAGASETYARMFKQSHKALAKPQQEKGEAVCFDRAGSHLYIGSEKIRQPIWEFELKPQRD